MKIIATLVPKIGQKYGCLGQADGPPLPNPDGKKPVQSVRMPAGMREFLNEAMEDCLPRIGGMGRKPIVVTSRITSFHVGEPTGWGMFERSL